MFKSWKEFKPAWIKALRSGEYKQGKGALCKVGKKHDTFCCLGVAANVLIENGSRKLKWEINDEVGEELDLNIGRTFSASRLSGLDLPAWLSKALRKQYRGDWFESTLIEMNDEGKSFKAIAKFIEKEM